MGGNAIVDPANKINLDMAADLWGLSPDALNEWLTTASMEVMKKTIVKKVAPAKYNDNRDAISKALFENSFLFVVERINGELFHLGSGDVKRSCSSEFWISSALRTSSQTRSNNSASTSQTKRFRGILTTTSLRRNKRSTSRNLFSGSP